MPVPCSMHVLITSEIDSRKDKARAQTFAFKCFDHLRKSTFVRDQRKRFDSLEREFTRGPGPSSTYQPRSAFPKMCRIWPRGEARITDTLPPAEGETGSAALELAACRARRTDIHAMLIRDWVLGRLATRPLQPDAYYAATCRHPTLLRPQSYAHRAAALLGCHTSRNATCESDWLTFELCCRRDEARRG